MVLAALFVIKFVVQPILIWQDNMVDKLDIENRKLSKLTSVMLNHSRYQIQLDHLNQRLSSAADLFYFDDAKVKLTIQKQIEKIFEGNGIQVEGFKWIFDRGEPIRALRASITYSGEVDKMTKTFWDLALLPQAVRQVAWNHRIGTGRERSSIKVTGDLTLEFYAWSAPPLGSSGGLEAQEIILSDGALGK